MKNHKQKNKRYAFINNLTGLLVFLIIILVILQIITSNKLALSGEKTAKVDHIIDKLETENNQFREKIASASALSTLQTRARTLGFTQTVRPRYLVGEPPVAVGIR